MKCKGERMMKNKKDFVSKDTRGRKIIQIEQAKKELYSNFFAWSIIIMLVRNILGEFNIVEFNYEDYLPATLFWAILDFITYFLIWIATFKLSMKKYSIRKVNIVNLKAAVTMINIIACVFITVSLIDTVKTSISEVENSYNELVNTYGDYGYILEYSGIMDEMDGYMAEFKNKIYIIFGIKIALSLCGSFAGCTVIKNDINKMGIDEEEYKLCTSVDINEDVNSNTYDEMNIDPIQINKI